MESNPEFIAAGMQQWARQKGLYISHAASVDFCEHNLYYLQGVDKSKHDVTWIELAIWCRDQFGKGNFSWAGSVYAFRTDEDRCLFKLRWG